MNTCPWPIALDQCCELVEPCDDPALVNRIIAQVSEMLTRWSGYRIGGCRSIRPLDPCGECRSSCCVQGDCIALHGVSEVLWVKVRGSIVSPRDYWFDAARGTLCSVEVAWPDADPRSGPPALEVFARTGEAPDEWALAVAGELACEMLASALNRKCRLPRNATTVTSQGVTVSLSQDELLYAIPNVYAWVKTVNPAGAVLPARVFSPEAEAARGRGKNKPSGRAPWRSRF